MVLRAATSLTRIVMTVQRLRQKIRNQVKKVFMKGTNNLLIFAINEFIIEYINQVIAGCENSQKS